MLSMPGGGGRDAGAEATETAWLAGESIDLDSGVKISLDSGLNLVAGFICKLC